MAGNYMTMGGITPPSAKSPTVRSKLKGSDDGKDKDFPAALEQRLTTPVLPNSGNFLTMGNVSPDAPAPKVVAETAPAETEKPYEFQGPPKPEAAGPERDMDALFAKATGTAFDPKSRVDVARKAELEDLMKSMPELAGKSDTQVALQWYRQAANAKRK